MASESDVVLQLNGVSKRYPGTLAVDRVDFEVRRGEVHALMGENGAGKSTLMKIIAGSFDDYRGEIRLGGSPVRLHWPSAAKANGIEMIYQELSLARPLSVAENILAGRLPRKWKLFLDRKGLVREAARWLKLVGLDVDPLTPVEMLSQHEAQLVEIAKALSNRPSILVMDEPTSALSREEVARLFDLIREMKHLRLAIIYISHHLSEVFQIADRVTVMRDGRRVDTLPVGELSPQRLAEMMVGRSIQETVIPRAAQPGRTRLEVKNFSRYGFFHEVSFQVRQGEILGVGGLAGSGRTELARSLCGIDPAHEGEILLDGQRIAPASMRAAMKKGFAYLTEDRKLQGLALGLTSSENLLSALNVCSDRLVPRKRARETFDQFAAELQLHPPDPARQTSQFSGGNQQKILLAKWLAIAPQVCILDEPTRGVDVGAKRVIHEAVVRLADQGRSVVLISSDLPELVGLSDRILILRKGRLVREMRKDEFSEDAVLLAASGEG